MNVRRALFVAVSAAAVLALPLCTTPAAAASTVTTTSVTTSFGTASVSAQWRLNPYKLDPLALTVKDTDADGHSVAVRLVTTGDAGKHYFPLHEISTGAGTSGTWRTYADPGGWISTASIQICLMEGPTVLGCANSRLMYPPFDDDLS
ncbi:hypothetical protein [Streptomyces sp. NBC_00344]|uniref:hypothetical protein n=1 Tax=Streptomyces sp. NBC_00344 TaxID=2975720 RepID=UPI002E2387A1